MIAVPQRRGACPSLSAPMQTGDGLLVRLKPLDGVLSPGNLAELAFAAARFGNGMLEITTRGSLQIRGLTAASARDLARFVDSLDIAMRDGVPIETAPLAGLDPEEVADPRPLAASLQGGIAQLALSAQLGPKVSVVVDGGGRSMLAGVKADVRLTAVRDGAAMVWRLALAGDAAGATFIADVVEADAFVAALDQLSSIAALGNAARARNLLDSNKEMSGSPEGGATKRNLGILPCGNPILLSDSRFAVRVELPFGAIDAATLERFSNALGQLGVVEFRLCPERSLLFLSDTQAGAMTALAAAHDAGLITDAADSRLTLVACAGSPACASAHYATKPLAEAIASDVAQLLDPSAKLHLSGCDKRCAEPSGPSIAVIGCEDGCVIVSNGTSVPPALRQYFQHRGVIRAEDRQIS